MIRVTRFDGSSLFVNSDLIEFVESTPDTIITLTTGHKLVVREAPTVLLDRVAAFQRRVRDTSAWVELTAE